MARPRLTIGIFGDITVRAMPSGRIEARTRFRDWDGRSRIVQATGDTVKAAEQALKAKLSERPQTQSTHTHLTPDSLFGDLVTYWLEQLDLEGRVSRTTRLLYERNRRTLVLPVFEHLALRESGVARCDRFIRNQFGRPAWATTGLPGSRQRELDHTGVTAMVSPNAYGVMLQ